MTKHIYIPIIKGKQYDLRALGKLQPEVRELIKPLIELPPTPYSKNIDDHLKKFIQNVSKYGGTGKTFVDFYGFLGEMANSGKLATIAGYDLLHDIGQAVTPVYGFNRHDGVWKYLEAVIKKHKQGFCFRLEEDDLEEDVAEATWDAIRTRTSQLQVDIKSVDLIIDLRDIREKLVDEKIALVTDFMSFQPLGISFRSIAIAGSSAPKDVSVVEKDSIGDILRKELIIWKNLRADLAVGDTLIYSDYGVIHPDFAADDLPVGGSANCKIRYTAGKNILIFRGHKRAGDSGQPFELSKKVRSHPKYCGRDYSFGDEYIDDVADRLSGPGHLGNWVLVDMNHHLTLVSTQIEYLSRKLAPHLTQEDTDILLDEIL
ncbi:MAG: beta family protein [Nitrososphaerales archaeon]